MTRLYWLGAACTILITSGTTTSFAQVAIKNTKLADLPFEQDVAINPSVASSAKNPGNIVVAMALDKTFYSTDAGKTWSESTFAGTPLKGIDPIVVVDVKGDFHYLQAVLPDAAHPELPFGIVTRGSYNKGMNWTEPTWVGNPHSVVQRKPRSGIDNLRGNLYTTWTQYDILRDTCYSDVKFSESSNDGKRWSDAIQINRIAGECNNDSKTVQSAGTVLSVEGKLFTAWSFNSNIYFDRSFDMAKTWLQNDIGITKVPGGSALSIPGIKPYNSESVLVVDNSISFFRTSLYAVYADQTNGVNDTDIWMLRSTMRGDLWSLPLRVNSVKRETHQFMPWMAVDEYSGIIYVAYYDRSTHNDTSTDVYLAYSVNGGKEFKEIKVSETAFTPSADKPFADHLGLGVYKGVITVAWTRQDSTSNSLWVAVIHQEDLVKPGEAPKFQQIKRIH